MIDGDEGIFSVVVGSLTVNESLTLNAGTLDIRGQFYDWCQQQLDQYRSWSAFKAGPAPFRL